MVAPGSFASTAAVTLARSSPVRTVSVLPLAWWGPAWAPAAEAEPVAAVAGSALDVAGAVLVLVCALAGVVRRVAPTAPPATVAPRRVAAMVARRRTFMV